MSQYCLISYDDFMSDVECIAEEIRPFRIGVTGTHCSGKTTLVNAIYPNLNKYVRIKEVASRFKGDKTSIKSQEEILDLQIYNESLVPPDYGFISDRTVIDNLAYCMYVNDVYRGDGDIFERCVSRAESHLRTIPYEIIIHVCNRLPMQYSPHRNLTSKFSQEYIAKTIDYLLNEVYMDETPCVIPVSGTTESMLLQIVREIARCE